MKRIKVKVYGGPWYKRLFVSKEVKEGYKLRKDFCKAFNKFLKLEENKDGRRN